MMSADNKKTIEGHVKDGNIKVVDNSIVINLSYVDTSKFNGIGRDEILEFVNGFQKTEDK